MQRLTILIGTLDTTVKLKWTLSARPNLTRAEDLGQLLAPFGSVESSDIVISLKPAPPKKPKRGTALVPFKQIGDAFAAVCSSGSSARGLQDVEVSWAEGKEPELIGWLKKMGKLGGETKSKPDLSTNEPGPAPSHPLPHSATPTASSTSSPFSSFPSTFVSDWYYEAIARTYFWLQPDLGSSTPSRPPVDTNVKGVDYESLTLMRLRQAERDRLEREIREQEAMEG